MVPIALVTVGVQFLKNLLIDSLLTPIVESTYSFLIMTTFVDIIQTLKGLVYHGGLHVTQLFGNSLTKFA